MIYDNLPISAKQIPNALTWVTPDGELWGQITATYRDGSTHLDYGKYFKYTLQKSKANGYVYGPVKYYTDDSHNKTKLRSRRVHILVAEAFVDNPNHYFIVGHKNNIKHDNRAVNLYWTTAKENTKKAFDDGLAVNAKGYEDSQSQPVIMFDTKTNIELGRYGSILEASRKTGIGTSTIARQAKYKHPVQRPYYFRFQDDESLSTPRLVIHYDVATGRELGRYINFVEASEKTGISKITIRSQCERGGIPIRYTGPTHFMYSQCAL